MAVVITAVALMMAGTNTVVVAFGVGRTGRYGQRYCRHRGRGDCRAGEP